MFKKVILLHISSIFLLLFPLHFQLSAQPSATIQGQSSLNNPILTAVPFLLISPDTRHAGMGEVGVATSADASAIHWNIAKIPFATKKMSFALSYTPWLRAIIHDVSLAYLSMYRKLGASDGVAASLRYFNLGSLQFTDIQGNKIRDFQPTEFSFDVGYARKINEKFSMGVVARFIYSNLSGGITNSTGGTNDAKPGISGAVDVGAYYRDETIQVLNRNAVVSIGMTISNIGFKISYNGTDGDFLPTNLRVGAGLELDLNTYNSIIFNLDLNKLMVPTPQAGVISNDSFLSGMFTSFGDAPGGFQEELQEIIINFGFEYWYNKLVAFRMGYLHEAQNKGNRQYFTIGAGLRYRKLGLDLSYLIVSRQETQQVNPLANTIRITLLYNLD